MAIVHRQTSRPHVERSFSYTQLEAAISRRRIGTSAEQTCLVGEIRSPRRTPVNYIDIFSNNSELVLYSLSHLSILGNTQSHGCRLYKPAMSYVMDRRAVYDSVRDFPTRNMNCKITENEEPEWTPPRGLKEREDRDGVSGYVKWLMRRRKASNVRLGVVKMFEQGEGAKEAKKPWRTRSASSESLLRRCKSPWTAFSYAEDGHIGLMTEWFILGN